MSELNIPEEIQEIASDVAEKAREVAAAVEDQAEDVKEESLNLADKTLAELSDLFQNLKDSADRMSRSKEAESIKSAFYKLLLKLKGENNVSEDESGTNNPFEAVEQNFKAIYADYKKERAEFNKQQDAQREENLKAKQAIIEELKALVEGQDDVSAQFPAFRELQNRWRDAGPVPATSFRNINDTYQFFVEKFYDMIKINRDLRDLDFKKNLEAKQAFCEAAEKLAENENIVNAFHELQKLHEQWKEFGPVAKEYRDDIWNRFKAATAVINKRYQAHFEELKGQQEDNLKAKTALCERLEEIAAKEVKTSGEWNALSKEIEDLQAEWRKIGFATKKENQKIYDRFRAACDKFFDNKEKNYGGVDPQYVENLHKKLALIEEIKGYEPASDRSDLDALKRFTSTWNEIGFVPFREKENVQEAFRTALHEKFPEYRSGYEGRRRSDKGSRNADSGKSERDKLLQKYHKIESEIATYENNMGFFANSKNAETFINSIKQKIEAAKAELEELEEKIKTIE